MDQRLSNPKQLNKVVNLRDDSTEKIYKNTIIADQRHFESIFKTNRKLPNIKNQRVEEKSEVKRNQN